MAIGFAQKRLISKRFVLTQKHYSFVEQLCLGILLLRKQLVGLLQVSFNPRRYSWCKTILCITERPAAKAHPD